MRTNGRTDTTKLIVAFRNFAKAPKKMHSFSQRLFTKQDQECEGIINIHHMTDTYIHYVQRF